MKPINIKMPYNIKVTFENNNPFMQPDVLKFIRGTQPSIEFTVKGRQATKVYNKLCKIFEVKLKQEFKQKEPKVIAPKVLRK